MRRQHSFSRKASAALVAVVSAVTMLCSGFSAAAASYSLPDYSSSKPIKAYTITTANTPTYTNENLTTRSGSIYASDEVWIDTIKKSSKGWVARGSYKVTGTNKRKTAWFKLSAVTPSSNAKADQKGTATAGFNTVRRPGVSTKAGAVDKGDQVYRMGVSGSYTNILYNVGSTSNPSAWRLAWVTTSTYSNSVKIQSQAQAQTSSTFTGYVNTQSANLNLRKSPTGSVIGSMPRGAKLTVLDNKKNYSGFYKVIYNGTTGYASCSYISFSPVNTNTSSIKLSYGLYKNSSARITCGFDGYTSTPGRHEGIDISLAVGKPIYSLTDGVVVRVANGYRGSAGLSTIAIYCPSKNKTVVYLHSAPASGLYAGKTISKGQQIGTQDWRGVSSAGGSHTHVEVVNGRTGYANKSVNDYKLDNANPTSFWNSFGYTIG